MTTQKNLGNFTELFATRAAAGGELERKLFETGHFAAIDAHEVRVLELVILARFTELESPKLVAQIELREEPSLGEFVEYSVNGRLIKTELAQGIDHFAVAQRFAMVGQILEHPNPRGRAPQAGTFENTLGPGGVMLLGFFGRSSHGCLAKTW
jgi:hypothetical protein